MNRSPDLSFHSIQKVIEKPKGFSQKHPAHSQDLTKVKKKQQPMGKMGVTKKSRTPLKARTQSPARVLLLNNNDDEFERAQSRAVRAAANRKKSLLGNDGNGGGGVIGRSISSQLRDEDLLDKDQILDLLQNCIKLASENKINQRNTWELSLIDHLSDIIKVDEDDTETNFQKASCTLEAGVKIYSLRVDSVHTEAYKVLGGINRTGTGDQDHNGNGEEGENGVMDQDKSDGKKDFQKTSDPSTTLEPSFESLNVKKFDVAFTVDPLYQQTSAQFDEGGARGLLLNTLGVYNDCRIMFDSWDIPGKNMKSGFTQNRESFETINVSFIKDCIEQMVMDLQTKREISPTLKEILRLFDDPIRNSAEAILTMQNEDETLDSSLDNQESLDEEGGMDEAFDDVSPQDFDCNDNGGVLKDGLINLDSVSGGAVTSEWPDNEEMGYGELEFEYDKDLSSEKTVDYLFLGMGVSAKSNAWAGPDHWKYRRVKDVQQISDAGNEASLNDNKVKKRKREPFSIDFLNRPDTENGAAFAPPKNQRLLLLPQSSSSGKTTLPEDCHYQPEGLVKLFLLPSVMCIGKQGRKVSDNSIESNNSFEPSATWGNEDGFDPNWDDAQGDIEEEYSNEKMVVQPRKVQKIQVDYDKTSKQVDVHVLKKTLWGSMQDFWRRAEMEHDEKPETIMSFKGLLSSLPPDCPAAAPEDISVHLCFICVLHLANEHCLSIRDCPNLDELCIQIPASLQK